jgi:hypothetical protein
MIIFTIIFFCCFFITGLVAFFFSWGAKDEISSADTEYSQQLYRSSDGRLFSNQWPLRSYVLFTEEPPTKIASTRKLTN